MKSWRDEQAEMLDKLCELSPEALGIVDGVVPKIDRQPLPFWKNRAAEVEQAPAESA